MNRKLTLGSLFDGSGGFPLGAILTGIEPEFASEVEPFPIRVTTKRLPQVKHLGDIAGIHGGKIPPVDIITFGSPCQDLSVAGRRAGLEDGARSNLFYEAVRIIKEMRCATDGKYPSYAVWENVPGAYSSNKGQDFRSVLEALLGVKDETVSVPMPEDGRWSTAGEIVGDGFSLAWRTLDAQFWGVPQRRLRCFLVVDFAGERAGEILFDETRLSGNPAAGCTERQGAAGSSEAGTGDAVGILNDQGGHCMSISEDVTGTLRAQEHGHTPIVFEPGAASRVGGHVWNGSTGTLRADAGDNQPAVCIENHPADSRVRIAEDGIVQTLPSRMGTGGGNVPLVMNERQYKNEADGNSVPMTVYGICSFYSNSMLSANPHSGIYEAETVRTLDTSIPDPNKNAGGMAVVAIEGNGSRPSHRGDGYGGEVSFTLNSVEKHAVCYQDKVGALCASDYKFPQSQQIEEGKAVVEQMTCENHQHGGYREVTQAGTLKASGGDYPGGENVVVENRYVVRRLTPTECAMLQGFQPDWCAGLETPEPTEEDIAFWTEVWETHRRIIGTSTRPKSRNLIVKWLKDPHSDSAEYKMWGNGVCLNCVVFVLSGIVHCSQKQA